MSTFDFIVNPAAGRGRGRRVAAFVKSELDRSGMDYTFNFTQSRGEATELAKVSRGDVIVSVGGDGTINEVVNGLVGGNKEFGIIPCGSGNDLIKSLGIPTDPLKALAVLEHGGTRAIDIGRLVVSEPDGSNSEGRHFVNGVGIGFDAEVAERTTRIPMLSGTLLYLAAVFQTLGRYASPKFTIDIDGTQDESNKLLVAIGNGICAGGGFYLTPQAEVDDSLLDVCLIDAISIPKILRLIPQVMKGNHLNLDGVTYVRGRRINIKADTTFFVHTDGEIVGNQVKGVSVDVLPRALRVRCVAQKQKDVGRSSR